MVVPNNHGFSYLKSSFWGVLGVPLIFGNAHIPLDTHFKKKQGVCPDHISNIKPLMCSTKATSAGTYHPWESGTGWETMGSGVPQVPKNSRGYIWMFPKIGGKHPQNGWFIMFIYNGKLFLNGWVGVKHPLVFGNTHISS